MYRVYIHTRDIIVCIILYSLPTSTRKPASIISSVSGRGAKCKGGLRVPDDGWRDTFCLMVAINLFDASSTVAAADSVLR